MDTTPSVSTTATTDWQQRNLQRLQRLLCLIPEQAPAELTPLEAFALIEWCRMTALADCDASGASAEARHLLRARSR